MNSTLTINLSAAIPTSDYTTVYGPYTIKGITPVVFNLYQILEERNPVLHVVADFGDGSSYEDALSLHNTFNTADTLEVMISNKIYSVNQNIYHTYVKQTSSFSTSLTAIFSLYYASNFTGTHKVVFNLTKDSYYSTVKNINILSTQIMPTTSHDIFALASGDNGNVFNLYLSKNELPVPQLADDRSSTYLALATQSGLPLISYFYRSVLIPKLSS